MGMYDDIVCKYPLPLPEDTKGFYPSGFQTKDLENALDCYEIREDGTIWLRECEREYIGGDPKGKTFIERLGTVKETKVWWTQVKLNKIISIYTYQHGEGQYDYWVEFAIDFVDGIVNKIQLKRFEANDNAKRKKDFELYIEEIKERKKFESTLFYKVVGKPYNKSIKFTMKSIYRFASFLMGVSLKLEHKLLI